MSESNSASSEASSAVESSDNSEAVNQELGQEQQAQEVAAITPRMIKKLKIKVDQQEFDEELPFEVDENNKAQIDYLRRHLQMSKAAGKRMDEAATTRKQAEQFFQALQHDPMKVLLNPKVMGNEKFQAIAEQFLFKHVTEQHLSPEERKRIEMEEKLRGYEESEKKQREQHEAKQVQQLEEHYAQQYQTTIMTALQSSNLPKNAFTVRRMADLMQKNIQHGLELEPQHLAQLVKEDYQRELASLVGGSDADQLLAMFGEDVANKIRKKDLEKLKAGQFQANPQNKAVSSQPKQQSSAPISISEWKRQNGHG